MREFVAGFQAFCPRCKCAVRISAAMTTGALRRATELRRAGRAVEAIKALCPEGAKNIAEAKALVFHLTIVPGHCHRCRRPLTKDSESCPFCTCLNLDIS
jgi:hypothetical protein